MKLLDDDIFVPLSLCFYLSLSLPFQSGLTAYDVAKVSGFQAICDALIQHSNQQANTNITKVRVCTRPKFTLILRPCTKFSFPCTLYFLWCLSCLLSTQ